MCVSRPKNNIKLDQNSLELYLQCSQGQTDSNQEAWSASTVQVLNAAGVFGEGVQAGCRQTGSGQMQSPKTEGRSGLPGQGRGDVVRGSRQVRYLESRPEKSAGG